ncbi:hypothetical protein [Pengzhenrongella sp.]|uniref:hypothetical protein n=1 Tax=Pengzhenrongella sp. TaxID=2888820 RepID=UPI002F9564B8
MASEAVTTAAAMSACASNDAVGANNTRSIAMEVMPRNGVIRPSTPGSLNGRIAVALVEITEPTRTVAALTSRRPLNSSKHLSAAGQSF